VLTRQPRCEERAVEDERQVESVGKPGESPAMDAVANSYDDLDDEGDAFIAEAG
jgi:hypothetical protein